MKRELHDLLYQLSDDPPAQKKPQISEASRQRVDAIVERMNQENPSVPDMPKPVYDKPPQYKKTPVKPSPVSHFSENPSQSPVVRMHDRLLQDAMPQPDAERRPTRVIDPNAKHKSHKKKKTAQSKPRKKFQIEIKEELPPDIPRDTSVADRIRQEKLEAVLASAPPRTPEELRKEKVRERAARIREQMHRLEIPQPKALSPEPEPEEEIPAWEDKLSEFSQRVKEENSEQLRVFQGAEKLHAPVLSDMPEISPGEDTSLTEISKELEGVILDEPESPEDTEIPPENEQHIPEESKPKIPKKKSSKKKKKPGFIRRIALFWERIFKKYKKKPKLKKTAAFHEKSHQPAVFQPPRKVTEVVMTPEAEKQTDMNLDFTPTAMLKTVSMSAVKELPKTEKSRKKVTVTKRVKK